MIDWNKVKDIEDIKKILSVIGITCDKGHPHEETLKDYFVPIGSCPAYWENKNREPAK